LAVEFSECSAPAPELASGATSTQVLSEFTYWSCRELRSSKTKTLYYRIELVSDGEYVHMIPAPGKNAIDVMDFHFATAGVFQTCRRIRDITIAAAMPVTVSKCTAQ
jgi:hypothetical protein